MIKKFSLLSLFVINITTHAACFVEVIPKVWECNYQVRNTIDTLVANRIKEIKREYFLDAISNGTINTSRGNNVVNIIVRSKDVADEIEVLLKRYDVQNELNRLDNFRVKFDFVIMGEKEQRDFSLGLESISRNLQPVDSDGKKITDYVGNGYSLLNTVTGIASSSLGLSFFNSLSRFSGMIGAARGKSLIRKEDSLKTIVAEHERFTTDYTFTRYIVPPGVSALEAIEKNVGFTLSGKVETLAGQDNKVMVPHMSLEWTMEDPNDPFKLPSITRRPERMVLELGTPKELISVTLHDNELMKSSGLLYKNKKITQGKLKLTVLMTVTKEDESKLVFSDQFIDISKSDYSLLPEEISCDEVFQNIKFFTVKDLFGKSDLLVQFDKKSLSKKNYKNFLEIEFFDQKRTPQLQHIVSSPMKIATIVPELHMNGKSMIEKKLKLKLRGQKTCKKKIKMIYNVNTSLDESFRRK